MAERKVTVRLSVASEVVDQALADAKELLAQTEGDETARAAASERVRAQLRAAVRSAVCVERVGA